MEWVTITVGAIEGVTAIILALVAASKKVRSVIITPLKKWLKEVMNEAVSDRLDNIDDKMIEITTDLEQQTEHQITILRHEITLIYEKYKLSKRLPQRIKQNLCYLYEQYEGLGGNSYVGNIVEEMMEEWEEV